MCSITVAENKMAKSSALQSVMFKLIFLHDFYIYRTPAIVSYNYEHIRYHLSWNYYSLKVRCVYYDQFHWGHT